jgi:ribosome recycling factor
MLEEIKEDVLDRMEKSVQALKSEFAKIRTGRAHPSLLDQVMVPYYGTDTPLKQVANVAVEDSRTLTVSPWEKPLTSAIEKAIMSSGLGLNPVTSGNVLRVPMPALTEERRKELIRLVRNTAEKGRVSVRNIRRDANQDFKDLVKEKEISTDDERRAQEQNQKETDRFISEIDQLLSKKEADLMEI